MESAPVGRREAAGLTRRVSLKLEEAIASGEFRVHERLPSERKLAELFGTSRMTIRGALAGLLAGGLVYIDPGRGTFVAERALELPTAVLWSFSEEMLARGQTPSSRLLELTVIPAALDLASVFAVVPGTPFVRISRVRLANNIPMGVEVAHLPSHLFPGLESYDLERESLYATLSRVYGVRPTRGHQTIGAAMPSAEQRALLELPPETPVIRCSRTSVVDDGHAIEFVSAVYRADRYLMTVDVGYSAADQASHLARVGASSQSPSPRPNAEG